MKAHYAAGWWLGWVFVLASVVPAFAQKGDVAVAVSTRNPVDGVSLSELRKIFAGEKRSWPGGLPIRIMVRARGAHERVVLLKLLGMSESRYKQYWTSQVFRGEALEEPVALFSNGMQKEALAVFPGAIALVSPQDLKPGMKVLKVEDLLPGEPGYPVH